MILPRVKARPSKNDLLITMRVDEGIFDTHTHTCEWKCVVDHNVEEHVPSNALYILGDGGTYTFFQYC